MILLDPRADLIGHWKLDEKQSRNTTVDSSEAGHDGSYAGNVVKRQPPADPATKYSAWFDGANGSSRIPSTPALHRLRHNVTIAAWVNPDSVSDNVMIFSNPGLWSFGLSGRSLWFRVNGYDYTISDAFQSSNLPAGQWSHVAAVFQPDDVVRFYLNGDLLGVKATGTPRRNAGDLWYLGTGGTGTRWFPGFLDDVQLYEAALVKREIQSLYDDPGRIVCGESWVNYGSGHPGTLGVPAISASGRMRLGKSFNVDFENSLGTGTLGVLFFGFDTNSAPLFGGELLVNIFDMLVLNVPPTGISLSLSIPDNPAVCGLPVYFQVVEKDFGAAGGYSYTRGLQVEIGS